jgi:hypothetical protein
MGVGQGSEGEFIRLADVTIAFSTPQYLARRNGVVIRSMRLDAIDYG